MSADALLSRLERVRKTGNGRWVSRCPAHDDKGPSLSVRELDDGRVLLHCFAGCEAQSVLDAVGLTFEDLFPERIGGDIAKRERRPFNAADVLRCLSVEALVILQYATAISRGEALTVEARSRLALAAQRFQHGAQVAHA
ncbi:DNA primase [Massilia sp. TN1-12]|uniref:DNA primase n=1 Tax=Massilia paldalensis TaxID=3377675 RepID=UPI00384B060B